jgi:hypothetical protein
MFNLLSNMNPEKLLTAFLTGMPDKTKQEWLGKMEEARQQAAQTADDFAHIKEVVDILLERLNEISERLPTIASDAEVAAVESAIAADNTELVIEEFKDVMEGEE